jgi:FixJ family two-component response regulator
MSAIVHVVDDDASFRTSISRLLRHRGYAVESYESAEQLLKRLPENAGRAVFSWIFKYLA